MMGCDRCGAQALAGESACPVCGLGLGMVAGRGEQEAPSIPVRRYGTVPPLPGVFDPAQDERAPSRTGLALAVLGAALIAAGIASWLW